MKILSDKYHLLSNLEGQFYLFELEASKSLTYKVFDMEMKLIDKHIISKDNVLNFNLVLDDDNNINLIFLLESGDLLLATKDADNWRKSQIGSLDIKSNIYYQLELLHINSKLHLIYSYSNFINLEIITMEHLIIDKASFKKNNIIRYVQRKDYDKFSLGFDEMGTIHLVYNARTNFESYIYYTFYNPYKDSWTINPKELSAKDKENYFPYLLIDSKSNLQITWLEMKDNRYKIKHARMPIRGKNKYIWQNNNIPSNFSHKFIPLIYEDDGELIILCYDHKSIKMIKSSDYGDKWHHKSSSESINSDMLISFTKAKNIYQKLVIKDLLAKNSIINDLNDIYLESIFTYDSYKENIVKKSDVKADIDEKTENQNKNENDETEEAKTIDEVQIELDNIKLLLRKLLKNQETILDGIDHLKTSKIEEKSSLVSKIFRGN